MLWMLQRVVFGTRTSEANARLLDLNAREIGLVLPLLALMLFMGVYPAPFLNRSRASVAAAQQVVSPSPIQTTTTAAASQPGTVANR
jgi:NADH-quinone oxidoreductase subunit M